MVGLFEIRGSYGTVGNDRLTNTRFPYLTLLKTGDGGGWGSTNGYITEETIGADNLKWEIAKKTDIGIEGKLFGERLNFVVDFSMINVTVSIRNVNKSLTMLVYRKCLSVMSERW